MVDPLRKARDNADRPESRAPPGLREKMPIYVVLLLGIVVAPGTAARGAPARGIGQWRAS